MDEVHTTVKILSVQPGDAWQCETCGMPSAEADFAACVEEGSFSGYVCGQCVAHSIVALLHGQCETSDPPG